MRVQLLLMICVLSVNSMAQTEQGVIPVSNTAMMEEGVVNVLHLAPGYATSVSLPEEITSVLVGNPADFKAEHSDTEPRLVLFKPITDQRGETNALITTKSGQQISLDLVSSGKPVAGSTRVDFLVTYRPPQVMGLSSDSKSFLIAETVPLAPVTPTITLSQPDASDLIRGVLATQKSVTAPQWQGHEVLAAVGEPLRQEQESLVGFSVLNNSKRTLELLPPQLELISRGSGSHRRLTKAEPIAISRYFMTMRRLQPGQRADGVIAYQRPSFKQAAEQLQLQLADAAQIDHPILLPVPFDERDGGDIR
jgi:hypothetical protein